MLGFRRFNRRKLVQIAKSSLDIMKKIADYAASIQDNIIAAENKREESAAAQKTPFIFRVICEDMDGNEYKVLLGPVQAIGHHVAKNDHCIYANYNHQGWASKLRSKSIGSVCEITIAGKQIPVKIKERVFYNPVCDDLLWDSINTEIDDVAGYHQHKSLREFYPYDESGAASVATDNDDIDITESVQPTDITDSLENILNEKSTIIYHETEDSDEYIEEPQKYTRQTISHNGILVNERLDEHQGELIDAPIRGNKTVILGPGGTGKTTTMIQRVRHSLSPEYINEVDSDLLKDDIHFNTNWLLFSPTDLLKNSLKESFAYAGQVAPDRNMVIWRNPKNGNNDFANTKAKEFGILKTFENKDGFIFDADADNRMRPDVTDDMLAWYRHFNAWQQKQFLDTVLQRFGNTLSNKYATKISSIGGLYKFLESDARDIESQSKAELKEILDQCFSAKVINPFAINSEPVIGDDGKTYIRITMYVLGQKANHIDVEPYTGNNMPANARKMIADTRDKYNATLINLARQNDVKLPSGNNTYVDNIKAIIVHLCSVFCKNGHTLPAKYQTMATQVMFDNIPVTDRERIDELNTVKFPKPATIVTEYFDGLNKRYSDFRTTEMPCYDQPIADKYISGNEIDLLIVTHLESLKDFARLGYKPSENSLKNLYHSQIYVDEITDFSTLQLRAIYLLCNPKIDSFFGCGDFNQRLNKFGVKNQDQLSDAIRGVEYVPFTVSYRQTTNLTDIAHLISSNPDFTLKHRDYMDETGVLPALALNAKTLEQKAKWIKDRICEIYDNSSERPSIAILVQHDSDIDPLANALTSELHELNIAVQACNSQSLGTTNTDNVRVFNMEYIKGLEFEAAFIIDIDAMSDKYDPDVLINYLYTGITRSAQFLAITCRDAQLPPQLDKVKEYFVSDWAK